MAKRKNHTAVFKAQVALAAIKGDKTVNEGTRSRPGGGVATAAGILPWRCASLRPRT